MYKACIIDNRGGSTKKVYEVTRKLTDLEIYMVDREHINLKERTAFVISSGTDTTIDDQSFRALRRFFLETKLPILGICGSFQLIGSLYGGFIEKMELPCFGKKTIQITEECDLFKGFETDAVVLQKHIYQLRYRGSDLHVLATSGNEKIEAIKHKDRPLYGVQFHPEHLHTGERLLRNFIGKYS